MPTADNIERDMLAQRIAFLESLVDDAVVAEQAEMQRVHDSYIVNGPAETDSNQQQGRSEDVPDDQPVNEPQPSSGPEMCVYFQRMDTRRIRSRYLVENERTFAAPADGDVEHWRESPDLSDIERLARQATAGIGNVVRITFEQIDGEYTQHVETLQHAEDGTLIHWERPEVCACGRCGERLYATPENFYRRSGTDRLVSWCKECMKAYNRARRELRRRGRKFGVELECVLMNDRGTGPMDADVIADALIRAGINCYNEGYSHQVHADGWKIVSDASVTCGWELVSPPLFWDEREQVETVCEVLKSLGAEADSQCGTHVHHEVADLNVRAFKRLVETWREHQSLTDMLTSPGRRDGQWSQHLPDEMMTRIEQATTVYECAEAANDRYYALNITCYPSYGTVECRQHQGTLNAQKVLAWIAYGQAMINAAVTRGVEIDNSDIDSLLDSLPINESHQRLYLKQRARELNPSYAFADDTITARTRIDYEDDDGYIAIDPDMRDEDDDDDTAIDW